MGLLLSINPLCAWAQQNSLSETLRDLTDIRANLDELSDYIAESDKSDLDFLYAVLTPAIDAVTQEADTFTEPTLTKLQTMVLGFQNSKDRFITVCTPSACGDDAKLIFDAAKGIKERLKISDTPSGNTIRVWGDSLEKALKPLLNPVLLEPTLLKEFNQISRLLSDLPPLSEINGATPITWLLSDAVYVRSKNFVGLSRKKLSAPELVTAIRAVSRLLLFYENMTQVNRRKLENGFNENEILNQAGGDSP